MSPQTDNQISRNSESEPLRLVGLGTASETGTEFFCSLVRDILEALGTRAAWVTEYFLEENKLSAKKVESFIREISEQPYGKQQLWVSQYFVARRWDHTAIQAEATLS